jgi:hypothetical protein
MASLQFDANTQNKDVGIVLTKTRIVTMATADIELPEVATFLKVSVAGILLWYFEDSKETNVILLEAGEFILTPATRIVYQATIDGVPYTTSPGQITWGVTSGIIGGALAKNAQ